MLAVHGCLFQAVGEDPTDLAPSLKGPTHCRLIDALGSTRYQRAPGPCSQPAHGHRVVDQRVVDMAGADHSKAAGFQQTHVAASVNDCRGVFSQASLQTARILGIGTADHPDSTCLPAFDDLA